jgi:hypothetical protein
VNSSSGRRNGRHDVVARRQARTGRQMRPSLFPGFLPRRVSKLEICEYIICRNRILSTLTSLLSRPAPRHEPSLARNLAHRSRALSKTGSASRPPRHSRRRTYSDC